MASRPTLYPPLILTALLGASVLSGCAEPQVRPSSQHVAPPAQVDAGAPPPVVALPQAPTRVPRAKEETYSVVVHDVAARDLLFALARDAKLDLDIAPDIEGLVSLNALNQTLPQILDRIARQVDMRWERKAGVLSVQRDTPFLRNYVIDYVNQQRRASTALDVTTQIAGSSSIGNAGGGAGQSSNRSTSTISSESSNAFWVTLTRNVQDLLRETDKLLPQAEGQGTAAVPAPAAPQAATTAAGTGAVAGVQARPAGPTFREAASVIANPETGILAVRATSRQHEKVREFIDQVMASARRQVLIEATVVEVELNDQAQSGVDWTRLSQGAGFSFRSNFLSGTLDPGGYPNNMLTPPDFPLTGDTRGFTFGWGNGDNFVAALKLLNQYGRVKVISSPKVTALNNQPAVLRVVDNLVYFVITAETSTSTSGPSLTTYTSTPNTVAVGFVMTVVPQVDEHSEITLNIRPTISRLKGYVRDPNPALTAVANMVPVVQTREIESTMKVPSGNVIMMGGLMEDSENRASEGLPVLGDLPSLGSLFSTRNSQARKSELVIFLRPLAIRDPSLEGDYRFARELLPDQGFFNAPLERPLPQAVPTP